MLDETHDPARRSFIASANGHSDFPIQNPPLAIISLPDDRRRIATAIGDEILILVPRERADYLKNERGSHRVCRRTA